MPSIEKTRVKNGRSRFLGLVLVAVFLLLVARWFPWQWLQDRALFVQWVDSIKGSPWAAPIFLGVFAVCALFSPVTPLSIACGVLFGFWKGLFLNLLASTLGAVLAFEIARILGRDAVRRLLRGRAKAIDEGLGRHGFVGMLIVRLIGVPPYIAANYMAGLSEIKLRDYILATVLGSIHWSLAIIYFSNILWQKFITLGIKGVQQMIAHHLGHISLVVGVFVILIAAVVYLRSRRKAAPQEAH